MTAYYNEFDPRAAQWLRELIKAGAIAPGEVDERSILDVTPADLIGFTQCHFFAGIGGWSLALRLAGWPDERPVWTGSCPCQPFSQAGRAKGFDDERHLWPAWEHLIRVCRPNRIFGEQVASADGRTWLALVQTDLEALGFAFGAADICAAGIGAPHIRQRLYWVGDSGSAGLQERVSLAGVQRQALGQHQGQAALGGSDAGGMADGARNGRRQKRAVAGRRAEGDRAQGHTTGPGAGEPAGFGGVADAQSVGGRLPVCGRGQGEEGPEPVGSGEARGLAYAGGERRQQVAGGASGDEGQDGQRSGPDHQPAGDGEDLGMADAGGRGREVALLLDGGGDAADREREADPAGVCRYNSWTRAEYVLCRDGKRRPFEPGIFPLAYGVSDRMGLLRGYGNAIVPQVAQAFIEAVEGV